MLVRFWRWLVPLTPTPHDWSPWAEDRIGESLFGHVMRYQRR